MMRLVLGTVQFGQNYGLTNVTGQVDQAEVKNILNWALDNGIDTLDTAIAYGESERILGQVDVKDFQVISKLPEFSEEVKVVHSWVRSQLSASLERLRVSSLYALMLHRPLQLLEANGLAIYQELKQLKSEGKIERIGVSIYSPEDLDALDTFDFDIVQAPMNLFDRRLADSGWLSRLKERGVEIHIRSVFLQGLLLMSPAQRPASFSKWEKHFEQYAGELERRDLSPMAACLACLKHYHLVDAIVVGVESKAQLQEVKATFDEVDADKLDSLSINDNRLINPANWEAR